ncbi:hypothetical protein CKO25_08465 [Thiocapsa imhoffii]|uniref:Glucose/Sorbosone dehydrogenase domain-containing protein n=1 Tax=Thiocapsa imhoffii TaxID=382777 RepID=A0A9X0WHA0_9GAMM|nr:PQQ-dependent sugar dehydrogenase [Thiocapsa imhoffii]MBK1644682.1 hypothetical protein [Thiocapsa imhoffii]
MTYRPILAILALSWIPLAHCSPVEGPVAPTGDVPEATGWRLETVTGGLVHPWAIAWLPDGSALITERPGRLRLLRDGVLLPEPVAGLPPILSHGQGGLMDVVLHPDFAENQWVYFTYATGTEQANRTALARGRWVDDRLQDVALLFENADVKRGGQHFGSRLLWLPDQSLLMSIGDGGNPPIDFAGGNIRDQAQRLETHFGKVVRLTEDGTPYPDNPFSDQAGARPEIHSYGHRNIQGLALDPETGRVWANEHGSRGGDELNLIEAGGNYGWPEVTYSLEYRGPRISDESTRPGMIDPVINWTPSKAPSGLAFYTGERYPDWQGDLFSGALVFGEVRRIQLDGDRVVGEEKLTIGNRVRDVRQGPDGYLYVLTDSGDGSLLRILPD